MALHDRESKTEMFCSKPRYSGETRNQRREGFGIYNYSNGFFQYEGEWQNGKRHGHGKLIMKDGSYYEGQFEKGEIVGSGVRKWAISGNMYKGSFMKGELHGKGVMEYGDGSVYDGEWSENKREGDGVLTEPNGTVYRGSFYKNKKHGDGFEVLSNGQTYNGTYVFGSKQGHGVMKFCDGSIYEGQWRSNMFNGEGSYIHCSGTSYHGVWINNRPEVDAFEIFIKGSPEIEIEQGQAFDLEIFCRNSNGKASHESGRRFHVMGGMRQIEATTKSALNEEGGEQPEVTSYSTPFGFDVEPYPLVENRKHSQRFDQDLDNFGIQEVCFISTDSVNGEKGVGKFASTTDQNQYFGGLQHSVPYHLNSEHIHEEAYTTETEKSFEITPATFQKPATEKQFSFEEGVSAQVLIDEGKSNDEKIDGISVLSEDGRVSIAGLFFPPPPQFPQNLIGRSSPDSEGRLSVKGGKKNEAVSVPSSIHVEKERKKGKTDTSLPDYEKSKDRDSKRKKDRKDDKVTEEKFCKPGNYVVVVEDITEPPFLGTTLKTAFLHVKVEYRSKKGKGANRKLNVN